jgi:aryl carrier-like protein
MSYSDWIAATHSKTTASWNLHKHLPAGMDFFVLLSSLCGIVGNLGQANYAAGNTYQDALAQHRVLQGEKATSLDIGAMASVGIIAENIDFIGLMGHDEDVIRVVQENEFHSVLDIYLGPDAPAAESEMGAQALVGMSTPQVYIDKGIELPSLLSQRLYASIARLGSHSSDMNMSGSRDADGINYPSLFRSASSIEDASSVVISALTSKLSRALSVAPEDLDPSKPLHQYGVDSLVAVELRNWFGKEFEASVTVLKIMNAVDVRAVAALVVAESTVTAHMT